MAKKVFSLASVQVEITNEYFTKNYGAIKFGGNGSLMGTIGYSYNSDIFTVEGSADGGAVVSHNRSLAGSINISFRQTADKINTLVTFINWCRDNPTYAESKIVCRDTSGNINFTADGVFPTRLPSNSVSDRIGDRQFNFGACEIVEEVSE